MDTVVGQGHGGCVRIARAVERERVALGGAHRDPQADHVAEWRAVASGGQDIGIRLDQALAGFNPGDAAGRCCERSDVRVEGETDTPARQPVDEGVAEGVGIATLVIGEMHAALDGAGHGGQGRFAGEGFVAVENAEGNAQRLDVMGCLL